MTNENQPKLEDMLLALSRETDVLRGLGRSKSTEERSYIYDAAAQMISNEKRGGENYERAVREFTRSPEYAHMQIEGHRDNFAHSIEDMYKSEKGRIAKDIEAKVNDTLKGAKDKATASMMLAQYLSDIIIGMPEFTQDQVDEFERREVLGMGLPYAFEARGSVEQYKNLELRKQASEYLNEIKEKDGDREKVVGYRVNMEKLGKAMDKVVAGASLYGRAVYIEERKKEQAEKKK